MNRRRLRIISFVSGILAASLFVSPGKTQEHSKASGKDKPLASKVEVSGDAAVHLPPMIVPFSSFVTPEAKGLFLANVRFHESDDPTKTKAIADLRKTFSDRYQHALERAKALYPVENAPATIAGVYADVITPRDGVSIRNKNRVLINLHGGGFQVGARVMGAMESIPVASLGKIKVITVDYRQGPEHKFPAASEDVTAIYKELLKSHRPQNIGIYGCSAGGVLTAETTAWIAKENLPPPGAIGIFCASAAGWSGGDSGYLAPALSGAGVRSPDDLGSHPSVSNVAYFSDADFDDPLVEPIRSTAVLAKFPPTLIITSTRDPALSPAVYTHTQLVKAGVEAELHVWEGLGHAFFTVEPDLPEAREAWYVVTKFFDKHLGLE